MNVVLCRSFKINCPAFIQLYADRAKDSLVITSCCVSHNHESALDEYPEHRRLNEAQKAKVTKFLDLGTSASFMFTCLLNCALL